MYMNIISYLSSQYSILPVKHGRNQSGLKRRAIHPKEANPGIVSHTVTSFPCLRVCLRLVYFHAWNFILRRGRMSWRTRLPELIWL